MSINLRSGLIRLAFANPSLRADILPLIAKHAGDDEEMGDMDTELEAEGDPTSHDQNLPEHYYFGKTAASGEWSAVFASLDGDFKTYNAKAVTDWNKVYKDMKKKGVKDAGAAAHFYHEYRAGRMDIGEAAAALAKEGVKPPTAGGGAEKQASTDKTAEERLENIEKLLTQFASPASKGQNKPQSYYGLPPKGKQASVKTAAGPDAVGRNWKEKNDGGKHRWVWAGQSGDLAFSVTEYEAPFGMYYKMTVVLNDGTMLQTVGQKLDRADWFKRAAAIYRASQGVMLDFSDMPEKWRRMASVKTAAGSGAANAAFLRQSPLKNKILQAVAKHYNTSVSAMLGELTDPDAEAVYEYIGDDAGLQMQVYREFNKGKQAAAAKAPAKLKGKKLDEAISKAYYEHGDRVQVNIMDIGKIYAAGKAAYEGAGTLEEAAKALDEAMKAAITKYRTN